MKGGAKMVEPIRNYDYFNLDDNGNLTFTFWDEYDVKDFGHSNKGLYSPSRIINELGVTRLKLMGFGNITHKDIRPNEYEKGVTERLEN